MRHPVRHLAPYAILRISVMSAVCAVGLAACSSDEDPPAVPATAPLTLTSLNLSNGGAFGDVNTCAGADASPALSWTGGPANTLTWAITLTDVNTGVTQWALWDIPAGTRTLPASLSSDPQLPYSPDFAASVVTKQSQASGGFGYEGPCPMGALHTFRLGIDAIGVNPLGVAAGSRPDTVSTAVAAMSLAHADITASSAASPPVMTGP
jgi:phosphatidylethanolamine-binding protein (PEBP) family uncharacterized protein